MTTRRSWLSVTLPVLFHWLREALDPTITTRRYTVDLLGWDGGRFYCFWLRRSANRFAENAPNCWPFVFIRDDLTGESVKVRDNPDKIQAPVRHIYLPPIVVPVAGFTTNVSSYTNWAENLLLPEHDLPEGL